MCLVAALSGGAGASPEDTKRFVEESRKASTQVLQQIRGELIKEMENMTIDQLQAAAKDEKRSQFERIVFSQAAAEKLKAEMAKGGK